MMLTSRSRVWVIAAAAIASLVAVAMIIPALRTELPSVGKQALHAYEASTVSVDYTVASSPIQQGYRFVFASDAANIPQQVPYDLAITPQDVPGLFQANGDPERRALIVSRPLLESVVHPTTGFDGPGGTPEYYSLMNVLWHNHILVALDSSSALMAEKLNLDDNPAPYDPFGRHMPTHPERDGRRLAATLIAFSVDTGFLQQSVSARDRGADEAPFGPVEPYDRVDAAITIAINTLDQ